jgi:lipopolysaccharide export system protein LptA
VENADKMVGRMVGDIMFRDLEGHVRISQDNVHITCDRATQNLTNNEAELFGNVIITQDTLLLKTPRGMYNGDSKVAWSTAGLFMHDGHTTLTADAGRYETTPRIARFTSRVTVTEPQAVITSDTLVYERIGAHAIVTGRVFATFPRDHAVVTADSAEHFVNKQITYFPAHPKLWQIDTTRSKRDSASVENDSIRVDTVSIVARRMEAHRDSTNYFLADGDVEMVRGQLASRCARATYYRKDSLIVLQTRPVLWYDRNQVTGDSIAILLADGAVRRLSVIGAAFSCSESKPTEKDSIGPPGRYDQTKGKNVHLFFRNSKAELIRVEQSAQSVYFAYDGRSLNGVRKESGDLILIGFVDGEAKTIRTIGGVEGTYYPEKYVTGKEAEYNLEGFRWRGDRPRQPSFPVRLQVTGGR